MSNSLPTKEPFLDKGNDGIPFIQCGSYRLRFDMEPLNDKYKQRAFEEIGETDDVRLIAINTLRKLVVEEHNLVVPEDDSFLLSYLRPCKFNIEKAFKKLLTFYKMIYNNPRYLKNLTPSIAEDVFNTGIIQYLPYRVDGARVMIIEIRKWNTRRISLEKLVKTIAISIAAGLQEPETQLCGVHVILDCEGFSVQHILQCSPWIAKLMVEFVTAIPLRIKGIHVINQTKIFDVAFAMFKPFIAGRLKRVIFLHGKNYRSLHEYISPLNLPIQFMGEVDIPQIPGAVMAELMKYYEQLFRDHQTYGYKN